MLQALEGLGEGLPPWAGWLVLILFLVLVLSALSRMVSWTPQVSAVARQRQGATLLELTEGQAHGWEDGLEKARAAVTAGDLRQGLWLLHRLLLLRLDQQDAICFDPAKTNSAYLRECSLGHPSRDLLCRLTEDYENVVYGHMEARLKTVLGLLEEVARL